MPTDIMTDAVTVGARVRLEYYRSVEDLLDNLPPTGGRLRVANELGDAKRNIRMIDEMDVDAWWERQRRQHPDL